MYYYKLSAKNGSVFISDHEIAKSQTFLSNNDIDIIINVTDTIPCYYKNKYNYIRIPFPNVPSVSDKENMKNELPFILKLINSYIENGKNILIHSVHADQRSPFIAIKYFREFENRDVFDELVSTKHSMFDYGKNIFYE